MTLRNYPSSGDREYTGVEAAVRDDIAALGELTGFQHSLAQIAITLARALDSGARGMAAAQISHQLRETLSELLEASQSNDAASDLQEFLSSALRDAKEYQSRHAGA